MLQATGVNLRRVGENSLEFHPHMPEYMKLVYSGLRYDSILLNDQIATLKRMKMLYDGYHFHVLSNVTGAIAKRYVCFACNVGCERVEKHRCDELCDTRSAITPCIPNNDNIPATGAPEISETPSTSRIIRV